MTQWETAKEIGFRLGIKYRSIYYWAKQGWIRRRQIKGGLTHYEFLVKERPKIPPRTAKFTEAQARDVKRYRGLASSAVIGVIFGMSASTVQNILRGEKHQRL